MRLFIKFPQTSKTNSALKCAVLGLEPNINELVLEPEPVKY